jgi:hypothetical protein
MRASSAGHARVRRWSCARPARVMHASHPGHACVQRWSCTHPTLVRLAPDVGQARAQRWSCTRPAWVTHASSVGHARVQRWSCTRPPWVSHASNVGHARVRRWSGTCPTMVMRASDLGQAGVRPRAAPELATAGPERLGCGLASDSPARAAPSWPPPAQRGPAVAWLRPLAGRRRPSEARRWPGFGTFGTFRCPPHLSLSASSMPPPRWRMRR